MPTRAVPASETDSDGVFRHASVGPQRVWQALRAAPGVLVEARDERRYRATVAPAPGARVWEAEVDWDPSSGGAVMHVTPASPQVTAWAQQVMQAAERLPHENKYCRGPNPDWSVPEPSIDAARSCDPGNFSSAIHELEKCGDHETTLRLLAMCVRSGHAAGLIRIAQLYETGTGLPQRADRMTHYLQLAARSDTPGYARVAKVMHATAVYFGEGVPADKAEGLRLMREAAALGDVDAQRFLSEGWHAAWRRADGSLYSDAAAPALAGQSAPQSR